MEVATGIEGAGIQPHTSNDGGLDYRVGLLGSTGLFRDSNINSQSLIKEAHRQKQDTDTFEKPVHQL